MGNWKPCRVHAPGTALAQEGMEVGGSVFQLPLSLVGTILFCAVSADGSLARLSSRCQDGRGWMTPPVFVPSRRCFIAPLPPPVFPVVTAQVNHSHSNLCLRVCFWGNLKQDTKKSNGWETMINLNPWLQRAPVVVSLATSNHRHPIPSYLHSLWHIIGTR